VRVCLRNHPSECCLGRKAEDDVGSFAHEIILPCTNFFVLQDHVDGERVKEHENGRNDRVYEGRRFGARRVDGAKEVDHDDHPGNDPCHTSINEGKPVGLLGVLVVVFHHDAKQVHGRVQEEDQDDASQIPDANQLPDENNHQR